VSRTRVRRRRLAAATLLVGVVLAGGQAARALGDDPVQPRSAVHVVEPGETLWSIAQEAAPADDPRPLIQAIEEANGVTAADLVPGLSLRVPFDA
jgi:hypothetical protein